LGYKVFDDLGNNTPPADGYQKIKCRMIYDVKHDGRHRGRLVAGGHLTPIPFDNLYSGVVSLRSLRLVTFLDKLSNFTLLWGAKVCSANLEAMTQEKVYFTSGEEFGALSGHTFWYC
jgi:hypothetical protein